MFSIEIIKSILRFTGVRVIKLLVFLKITNNEILPNVKIEEIRILKKSIPMY